MISIRRQFTFFFATAFIGLIAGMAAVGFQYGSQWLFRYTILAASQFSFLSFSLIAILVISSGAFFTGFLMQKFANDAPGSGIPQVKLAYMTRTPEFSWHLIWVKFFGGILSIGTGSSLGREGPTIHIGAALASKVASLFKEPIEAKMNAMCAGAAAGLAAAFNSPLAGVTLVLEEISGNKNLEKFAARSLLASAISVSIVYLFAGSFAALPIPQIIPMRWKVLWLSPFVALFSGCIGFFFQWSTLRLRTSFLSSFSLCQKTAIGAALSGCLCLIAFALTSKLGAFGLGDQDIRSALDNQIVWHVATILLITKLLATILCYSTMGCGGIFAPLLFFGAMSGTIVFGLTKEWLGLSVQDQTLLSIIGMTATLAAVVRAPLTSIIIVLEMTRQINALPALMLASVTAAFLSTLVFKHNFYNQSLEPVQNL